MEPITALDYKIKEMAARIRELREIVGHTPEMMAERQVTAILISPSFTVAPWH